MTAQIRPGEEVAAAFASGAAVVALETSVIGQGLPHPRNIECIDRMAGAIRESGAVPAWVGVLDGDVVVGLTEQELEVFTEPGRADKVARRDVPAACASGRPGATTVSATIWAAARGGIAVSATGGIGGVHRGRSKDVSADLIELSRVPGLLVCSGPKSIVEPTATAERLEELGVSLIGYGVNRMPSFLATESAVDLGHRVETPAEAAAILAAGLGLEMSSTIVLCNPVPVAHAMDAREVAEATDRCLQRADDEGIHGPDLTPFLLTALAEETDGRSLEANLALLEANARLAAEVAVAHAASGAGSATGARSG